MRSAKLMLKPLTNAQIDHAAYHPIGFASALDVEAS